MDSSPTEMANSPTDQLLGPKRNIRYTKEIVHIIIGQFALLSSEKSRPGLRTDARHYLFPLDVVNCSKNTMPGRELQQLLALSDFFCFDYVLCALKVRKQLRRVSNNTSDYVQPVRAAIQSHLWLKVSNFGLQGRELFMGHIRRI